MTFVPLPNPVPATAPSDVAGTAVFSYDGQGRLTSVASPPGGRNVTITYNPDGTIATVTKAVP